MKGPPGPLGLRGRPGPLVSGVTSCCHFGVCVCIRAAWRLCVAHDASQSRLLSRTEYCTLFVPGCTRSLWAEGDQWRLGATGELPGCHGNALSISLPYCLTLELIREPEPGSHLLFLSLSLHLFSPGSSRTARYPRSEWTTWEKGETIYCSPLSTNSFLCYLLLCTRFTEWPCNSLFTVKNLTRLCCLCVCVLIRVGQVQMGAVVQ